MSWAFTKMQLANDYAAEFLSADTHSQVRTHSMRNGRLLWLRRSVAGPELLADDWCIVEKAESPSHDRIGRLQPNDETP
jgi:hypothetical protein